MRAALSRSPE
jgi:glutathione S-transferase